MRHYVEVLEKQNGKLTMDCEEKDALIAKLQKEAVDAEVGAMLG